MSKSRRLTVYPSSYLEIAREFEGGARSKMVPCASVAEATRLRLDLYGFRRAIEAEGMAGDYPMFLATRLFVEGRKVRIVHVDSTGPRALRRGT